jgi:hypothetical protein
MRDAELTKIQDHFYRVKAKLQSCGKEEFFERAGKVDAHILAALQELSDVQDAAQSTVANRYRDDPKRGQRAKKIPCAATLPLKRQAAAAGGGCSATSTTYSVIDISDSEELEVLRNDGAPSSD